MKKLLLTSLLCVSALMSINAQTTFSAGIVIDAAAGDQPYGIDTGDLNGDGEIDIIISTKEDVFMYFKDGTTSNFLKQPTLNMLTMNGMQSVIIADLNGDGRNDIIVSSYLDGNIGDPNPRLVWYSKLSDGTFTNQIVINNTIGAINEIEIVDVNNDGFPDIVAVTDQSGTANSTGQVVWFQNKGGAQATQFLAPQIIETGANSVFADLADFDKDGDLDIVIDYQNSQSVVYYNQFIESGTSTVSWVLDANTHGGSAPFFSQSVGFGDVDDDGDLDITRVDGFQGEPKWYKKSTVGNTPAGTYAEATLPTLLNNPASVLVEDITGDGFTDIIVANNDNNPTLKNLIILESTGAGTYLPAATISVVPNIKDDVFKAFIADVDGDGRKDIITTHYSTNKLKWFRNIDGVLGVQDNTLLNMSIYPNPVTEGFITIKSANNVAKSVTIFDIIGKQVVNTTVQNNERVNVSSLNSGIYILKVNEEGKLATRKLIIQ